MPRPLEFREASTASTAALSSSSPPAASSVCLLTPSIDLDRSESESSSVAFTATDMSSWRSSLPLEGAPRSASEVTAGSGCSERAASSSSPSRGGARAPPARRPRPAVPAALPRAGRPLPCRTATITAPSSSCAPVPDPKRAPEPTRRMRARHTAATPTLSTTAAAVARPAERPSLWAACTPEAMLLATVSSQLDALCVAAAVGDSGRRVLAGVESLVGVTVGSTVG